MIILRCDGGFERGLGHVFRMKRLAGRFRDKGRKAVLVCRDVDDIRDYVDSFDVPSIFFDERSSELDIIQKTAKQHPSCDPWVFDLLDTAPEWIEAARGAHDASGVLRPIITLDDLGPGAQVADVVVNTIRRTQDDVSHGYYGLDYIIIDPRVLKHRRVRRYQETPTRIGVTLGGADTWGVTPRVVDALGCMQGSWSVECCLGPSFEHHKEMDAAGRALSSAGRLRLHRAVPDLHGTLNGCDVVISNGGMTMLELMAMGMPVLAIGNEPHESELIADCELRGAVSNIGYHDGLTAAEIAYKVDPVLRSFDQLEQLSAKALSVVDGVGIDRLIGIIEGAA